MALALLALLLLLLLLPLANGKMPHGDDQAADSAKQNGSSMEG